MVNHIGHHHPVVLATANALKSLQVTAMALRVSGLTAFPMKAEALETLREIEFGCDKAILIMDAPEFTLDHAKMAFEALQELRPGIVSLHTQMQTTTIRASFEPTKSETYPFYGVLTLVETFNALAAGMFPLIESTLRHYVGPHEKSVEAANINGILDKTHYEVQAEREAAQNSLQQMFGRLMRGPAPEEVEVEEVEVPTKPKRTRKAPRGN